MREATIKITPDNNVKVQMIIEGVSLVEILDALNTVMPTIASLLVKEYQEITGDTDISDEKLDDYANFLRNNKIG